MDSHDRRIVAALGVIGIGLGGLFDGILLHQVLQWHHLLGLVPGEAFRDLRTQILADGLFHILMYLVTAAGLWLLWRRRREAAQATWRIPAGGMLLGFGFWNVLDVGFFHWILGIHRIRVDVPDPMLYDIGWLVIFGVLPLALGSLVLRQRPQSPPDGKHCGGKASLAAALAVIIAAPLAALPQPNADSALVVLAPGSRAAAAFITAQQAGTPLMWVDPHGGFMVVRTRPGSSARLYAAGAFFVTRSPALAGCMASARV